MNAILEVLYFYHLPKDITDHTSLQLSFCICSSPHWEHLLFILLFHLCCHHREILCHPTFNSTLLMFTSTILSARAHLTCGKRWWVTVLWCNSIPGIWLADSVFQKIWLCKDIWDPYSCVPYQSEMSWPAFLRSRAHFKTQPNKSGR